MLRSHLSVQLIKEARAETRRFATVPRVLAHGLQGACTQMRVRTPDTPGNMAALMTLSQVTSRIT